MFLYEHFCLVYFVQKSFNAITHDNSNHKFMIMVIKFMMKPITEAFSMACQFCHHFVASGLFGDTCTDPYHGVQRRTCDIHVHV